MMGLDAPMGDGLSDLELSAVAEAMSQMMGTAANALGLAVGLDVAIAPPVCTVADGCLDGARARSRTRRTRPGSRSCRSRINAEVLQLMPADVASAASRRRSPRAAASRGAPCAGAARRRRSRRRTPPPRGILPGLLGFDSLRDVQVRVSAELGRASVPVADVMNLPPGAIVELDRTPSETIDILVNGRAFARARLVLVDGEYAAQIVSLEPPTLMAG